MHAAAGPLNHWFSLVSQGSNPPGGPASPIRAGGPPSVTGIGIMKAGQIYYNALLAKTSTWRYANARLASLNAAVNLLGASSAECATVKAAWNAVSVPVQAGEPSCGGGGPGPGTPVFSDTFETATNRAGAWGTATVNLSAFAGQTIRLRIDAADAATGSLIEAGVDDVVITTG